MTYTYYLTGGFSGVSKFPLGLICFTVGAFSKLDPKDIATALDRHAHCDWGDMSDEDRRDNDEALPAGFRLFSVYHDRHGVKFWIITEANRRETTVMLPLER
jgi:hypothetical protein